MKKSNAKTISLYGILTAAALLFGYVEYLVPLNFIAPGVKLGISNGMILLLILKGKFKSAFLINAVRIILSGFLFATPFSLIFSLTAGLISTFAMIILNRLNCVGIIGLSVGGGTVHNVVQLCVAHFTVGQGVWFYLPFLLISGLLAGIAVGFLTWAIFKKTDRFFNTI